MGVSDVSLGIERGEGGLVKSHGVREWASAKSARSSIFANTINQNADAEVAGERRYSREEVVVSNRNPAQDRSEIRRLLRCELEYGRYMSLIRKD